MGSWVHGRELAGCMRAWPVLPRLLRLPWRPSSDHGRTFRAAVRLCELLDPLLGHFGEHVPPVVRPVRLALGAAADTTLGTVVNDPRLVVKRPLLRVREHRVRARQPLKALCRLRVVGALVGMALERRLEVRLLDGGRARRPLDAYRRC